MAQFKIVLKKEAQKKKRRYDFVYLIIRDQAVDCEIFDKDGKQINDVTDFQFSLGVNTQLNLMLRYLDGSNEVFGETQVKLGYPPGHNWFSNVAPQYGDYPPGQTTRYELDNRVPYKVEETTGVCPECKGKGRVYLLNSFVPCNLCGKKEE